MRSHCRALLLTFGAALISGLSAAFAETAAPGAPAAAQEQAVRLEAPKPEDIIEIITKCLHEGREVFMSHDEGATCVPRGRAGRLAQQSGMPFAIGDIKTACADPGDRRQLSGDVVKRVLQTAVQKSLPIAPTGIRIIGALFCTELDIVGLDLPYSLVLDYSASEGRVFGRNLQIRGDLSIDGSFVQRGLVLTRSRISGSVYVENSFVGRVAVFDSQIQGSWHQTNSVVLGSAEFRGLTMSGDLGLAGSALSMVSVMSAQIAGGLVLNNSEARCAYHVRGSTFGYLFGETVGFGAMTPARDISDSIPEGSKLIVPWWSRLARLPAQQSGTAYTSIGIRLTTPALRTALQRELGGIKASPESNLLPGCEHLSHSENAEFYFLNNRVQSAVCLRSFGWLRPHNYDEKNQRMTVLSLNGTHVSGNLIIDLWGSHTDKENEARTMPETRILEAIGVTMGALIFDFTDNAHRYVTYLDGLKFNQVHTATVNCDFQRDQEGASPSTPTRPNGGVLQQPSLPTVQDVMRWLEKNGSRSSQPFAAFVDAYEHAGEDASDLKIGRKTADLCSDTARWLTFLKCRETPPPRSRQKEAETVKEAGVLDSVYRGAAAVPVFLALGFRWTLYGLADHGIRPGKVVWWVIGVLAVFFGFFWAVLGIVGFQPKGTPSEPASASASEPWPVSVLFLFDRLLPLYKIREEHYAVGRYYRRVTPGEVRAGLQDVNDPPPSMRFLLWTIPVAPVGESDMRRAEKWLLVLRIIGLVLTVFLLAAINALTRD
jgi:hypothetical protein